MHPILFRVPLPTMPLPLFWVLVAVSGVGLAIAAFAWLARQSSTGAIVGAAIAAAGGVSAYNFRGTVYDLGPTAIYSYGVMLGLSLVVGWYLTLGLAERDGLPKETMANNYVVTALAAIVGARLLYVATNLDEFTSLGSLFAMRNGGLVAYGGFLGGFVGSLIFLRVHGLRLMPWADVAVPSLASGLMITRIGCYLFGCDFGKPLTAEAPGWLQKLGTFPHWPEGTVASGSGSPAWVQHVHTRGLAETASASLPVHPTQIYESLVGLGLLGLLLYSRKTQKFRGQIFLLFTFAYGVCRFALEMVRDDNERGTASPSMPEHLLISLCFALFAVGFAYGFSRLIENVMARRVAQAAAFIPAVAAYVALRPEAFAASPTIQLSTSQTVGLVSGLAACVAFAALYKSALRDPVGAMELDLPLEYRAQVAAASERDVDAGAPDDDPAA